MRARMHMSAYLLSEYLLVVDQHRNRTCTNELDAVLVHVFSRFPYNLTWNGFCLLPYPVPKTIPQLQYVRRVSHESGSMEVLSLIHI